VKVAWLAMLLCTSVVGCSGQVQTKDLEPKPEPASKSEPTIRKLLSRTDLVLVKNFYTPVTVREDKDARLAELIPGQVEIGALWVYPSGSRSQGDRGGSVELTAAGYFADGISHGFDKVTAYLDLDELKDFDSALTYFESSQQVWNISNGGPKHVESDFLSKDGFSASAFRASDDKPIIYLSDENIGVTIPFSRIGELHSALRTAVQAAQSEQ